MFSGNSTPFTMDVVPAGYNSGGNGNGMWGGDSAWWIIILFLFVFCGWGNGGWGNGNGNGSNGSVMDAYVLNSDFATIQRQLSDGFGGVEKGIDTIRNGVCDGFYTQAQLVNGVQMQVANEFRGVDNAVCQLGTATQQGFNQTNIALMQGQNALQAQIAQCCCDNKSAIKDLQFQTAQESCAAITAANNNTRDLLENANANTRAILDKLTAQEIEAKNAEIARQNQQIFQLQLAASQQEQNNYLVNQLRPCPIPSYQTCNPWASSYNYCYNGCSGCGCGA